MPTEAHRETYASNLLAVGYRWEPVSPESEASPEKLCWLPLLEYVREPRGEATFWLHENPYQQHREWTASIQAIPVRYTFHHEPLESMTGSVLSFNIGHHMWDPGHERSMSRMFSERTQTDDGGAKLRNQIFSPLSDRVKNFMRPVLEELLQSSPEIIEEPTKEPHQEALEWIKETTGLSWEYIRKLFGVSRPTLHSWRRGGPIKSHYRRHLFAVRDVLERASKRNPRPSELVAWLESPRGAEGRTPAELLEAKEIGKARLLAITSPAPNVKAPPQWTQHHVLEAYKSSRERIEALPPEKDEELLEMLDEED